MSEPAIRLAGVGKRYPPREPGVAPLDLLIELDLTVARGEFLAIEGQSGSGKSTLLHLLGGLDRDFIGEVRVLGCDLSALSDQELAALRHAQIGFVFQSFNLLPGLSALENVLLPDFFGEGVPDAERRAREALARVGLADEPTGNLDAQTGEGVISLFRELHQEGMTLLIVTHEARVSHAADRVMVLREGRLAAEPGSKHPLESE